MASSLSTSSSSSHSFPITLISEAEQKQEIEHRKIMIDLGGIFVTNASQALKVLPKLPPVAFVAYKKTTNPNFWQILWIDRKKLHSKRIHTITNSYHLRKDILAIYGGTIVKTELKNLSEARKLKEFRELKNSKAYGNFLIIQYSETSLPSFVQLTSLGTVIACPLVDSIDISVRSVLLPREQFAILKRRQYNPPPYTISESKSKKEDDERYLCIKCLGEQKEVLWDERVIGRVAKVTRFLTEPCQEKDFKVISETTKKIVYAKLLVFCKKLHNDLIIHLSANVYSTTKLEFSFKSLMGLRKNLKQLRFYALLANLLKKTEKESLELADCYIESNEMWLTFQEQELRPLFEGTELHRGTFNGRHCRLIDHQLNLKEDPS